MSNYTTVAPSPTTATTLSQQWIVAPTEPCPTSSVNYKTINFGDGEYEEFRTKYHNASLERLEKLDRRKAQQLEDMQADAEEFDGLMLMTPRNKRR